jgi:hypothetical protein
MKIQENKRLMKIKGFTEFHIYIIGFSTSIYRKWTSVYKLPVKLTHPIGNYITQGNNSSNWLHIYTCPFLTKCIWQLGGLTCPKMLEYW